MKNSTVNGLFTHVHGIDATRLPPHSFDNTGPRITCPGMGNGMTNSPAADPMAMRCGVSLRCNTPRIARAPRKRHCRQRERRVGGAVIAIQIPSLETAV